MAETNLLWHTRPTDDSAFFAGELTPFGIHSIIGPVLHIARKPLVTITQTPPHALLLTSRHAAHALSLLPASWRSLPVYCVGNATAKAAGEHGFTRIISGMKDVQALLPRIAGEVASGSTLLYLAGDETRSDVQKMLAPRGITVSMVVVYYAIGEQELTPEIITALEGRRIAGVALFSPRTARISAALMQKAGLAECARGIAAYCFSENVALEAQALPWAAMHTCSAPTRAAMRELIVSHHPKSE